MGGRWRGHQGQDMFARCGTRLALARGGEVQFAGYHGAAGNYVVVDTAGSGIDHVYMHLNAPALVSTGDRVFTGQKIGEVGDTGARHRLPPALRDVDRAGLVRGRAALRSAALVALLGRLQLS